MREKKTHVLPSRLNIVTSAKKISRTKNCPKKRKMKDGNFTSINVLSMFLSQWITRINICTYKFNIAWEMFSDRNSDLLSLSGTQIFFFVPYSWHVDHIISHFFTELKIYHQSLIFNFSIFCTTDLWYSKCFKIVPNSSKLKWPQLVSWKGSYMCFLLFIFSKYWS